MNKWLENAGAFAVADLKAFRRDGQAMFWTFFFPIMFMVLLGVVFGNQQLIDLKVGIVDNDHSTDSRDFGHRLDAIDHVQVVWFDPDGPAPFSPAALEARNASAAQALVDGDVAVYVVIPSGYQAALADHYFNQSNATSNVNISVVWALDNNGNGQVAKLAVQQYISEINFAAMNESRVVLTGEQPVTVTRGRYIDYLVPGILAMNTMFSGIFSIAVVMTTMRQKGILRRLKVTPVAKSAILAALITTRMLIIFVSMILILLVGVIGFGVDLQGNLALLVLLVVIGTLTFTTFGFAVSAYAKTVESAEAIANTVAMPMMFLGDVFLPVASMPAFIQPVAAALPLSYLGTALRDVGLKGGGLVEVALPVLAVCAYGIVGFLIAMKLFKWE